MGRSSLPVCEVHGSTEPAADRASVPYVIKLVWRADPPREEHSMVTVIIAAHGHLAPALIDSSTMIMGEQDGVKAVTFDTTEGLTTCSPSTPTAAEGETTPPRRLLRR